MSRRSRCRSTSSPIIYIAVDIKRRSRHENRSPVSSHCFASIPVIVASLAHGGSRSSARKLTEVILIRSFVKRSLFFNNLRSELLRLHERMARRKDRSALIVRFLLSETGGATLSDDAPTKLRAIYYVAIYKKVRKNELCNSEVSLSCDQHNISRFPLLYFARMEVDPRERERRKHRKFENVRHESRIIYDDLTNLKSCGSY